MQLVVGQWRHATTTRKKSHGTPFMDDASGVTGAKNDQERRARGLHYGVSRISWPMRHPV